jgi:hypothetical protein
MNLYSKRFEQSTDGKATIAHLYLGLIYECFIIEDQVREPKDRPSDASKWAAWVKTWKVPGKTAIPSGTYEIDWTRSPKFSARAGHDVCTLEILGVAGFQGIRFHAGNDPEDTEGCQLPGRTHVPGAAFVGESTLAIRVLENKIKPILEGGEKVFITITNEFDSFFSLGSASTA